MLIRIHEEFKSEADAKRWADNYYRRYPAAGYSTRLTISSRQSVKELINEKARGRVVTTIPHVWTVTGTRHSSAD